MLFRSELNPRVYEVYTPSGETFTVAKFENLNFENLIQTYWKNLFDSLNETRIISNYFNLNRSDVIGFDFKKSIYVDYFKSYFFVFEIVLHF